MKTSNRKFFTNFSVGQLGGRWMKDLHQRDITEAKLEEGYQLAYTIKLLGRTRLYHT